MERITSVHTRRMAVLDVLCQAVVLGKYVASNSVHFPKGPFVYGPHLEQEDTGGSEGLRRLRELRNDYSYPIEKRHIPGYDGWWYRIDVSPEEARQIRIRIINGTLNARFPEPAGQVTLGFTG